MLDTIIRFSIRNKAFVAIMTLGLIVWGVWSALRLHIDVMPDITNNQVQVISVCPTLAGQEVEQLVTFPVEQSLANLPDLDEIRSISRFGLSVVTIVFEEDADIYFARQLVHERLDGVTDQMPPGACTLDMAPVSTGLGEVYQYILHPKEGSEDKYDAKDLRTMQDWIVARQLYGIPGVAEVNSFGGELKQYEVAVDPNRLKAMGISLIDLFDALERNNQNTGGAYIDKKPNAYFIRGIGLVTSLEDVASIAVSTSGPTPVFVRDVATVRFGSAVRYGALTYNGEVDAVGGVVMMLKGHNAHEVIGAIKERLPAIQQSLPDDVILEAYLDRTDLVDRTIRTVRTNLMEGALIVIFVLVLFLGNARAGLIVSSAIPLSMLFALGMMNLFGVSANLMSLGAIDFGLIVDGSVIVVEAALHHLGFRKTTHRLSRIEMDEEVFNATSKIRQSAAFGEIIILIVYLPILALSGVEGKMFAPMAQTVGFAILGALILSMTYIPMMCARFLTRDPLPINTVSDRFMARIQRGYGRLFNRLVRIRGMVVGFVVALFAGSILLFSTLGGEFIPQLNEGNYAFHCILPLGSSLSQSVETSMHAARLIREFDEVKMVVGKTGAAEVPTDPMPPNATDLMIILKPESDWTSGRSYDELADAILERLETIPGVFFEKNQPIQMRFNELMTGVRQDIAVKLFGENLDTLAVFADRIAQSIRNVPGVTEPQVEQVAGLPQIEIVYDRNRAAQYGLDIADLNRVVSIAFAGQSAGVVYENERRFDLTVRLDVLYRSNFEDIGNLQVPTRYGTQIPLSQVADIGYRQGPAQISREDGRRRIVVSFNVDGSDMQTVMDEVRTVIDTQVDLPSGYFITFGGQFENLRNASNRLAIAIPIAMALIFALLYATFRSASQSALIFMSIPMSAIGGIVALYLRGMPFSISAGVGFIALFGVAVLNGIVLVGTFNQLEKDGIRNVLRRIKMGTRIRLRPVLMTAAVASLGFLPMALSTGAGAEVQKPLATVVIGGLTTATLLTLFVIPMLYLSLLRRKRYAPHSVSTVKRLSIITIAWMVVSASSVFAQERISVDEAVRRAFRSNLELRVSDQDIRRAGYMVRTAVDIPPIGVFMEKDDMRPSDPEGVLKIGLEQSLEWPGVYGARKNLAKQQHELSRLSKSTLEAELKRDVYEAYFRLWYLQEKRTLNQQMDSLYSRLRVVTERLVQSGDAPGIDRIASEARLQEIRVLVAQDSLELMSQQRHLMVLLRSDEPVLPLAQPMSRLPAPELGLETHPIVLLQKQAVAVSEAMVLIQQRSAMPSFAVRAFSQRLLNEPDPLSGVSLTVSVPLFGLGAQQNRIRAATANTEVEQARLDVVNQQIELVRKQSTIELEKDRLMLQFYEVTGLRQAEELLNAATLSYNAGEIGYADLSWYLDQAIAIQQSHLSAMDRYNQSAIQLNYIYRN